MEKKKVNNLYKEIPLEEAYKMVDEQTLYVKYLWFVINYQLSIIQDKNSDIDDLETAFSVYKSLRDIYFKELDILKSMRRYLYYGKVC